MSQTTPGMHRNTDAAPDCSRAAFATQMGLLFVADKVCGDLEFFSVDLCTIGQRRVLEEELQGIHLQYRGGIFHRGHRQEAALWMIGRPPCALAAAIRADPFADNVRVRNLCEDVWNRWRTIAAISASAPNFRVDGGQGSILLCADFDFRVSRRPISGGHQLQIAVEHQFDRSPGLFGQHRAGDTPSVVVEFRSKTAAHVLAFDMNFVLRDANFIAKAVGIAGDILSRRPDVEFAILDIGDLAVRFQAAMRDDGNAIESTHSNGVTVTERGFHVPGFSVARLVLGQSWISIDDLMLLLIVLDFHQPRGLSCNLLRFGSDCRDQLAHVLNLCLVVLPDSLHTGQRFSRAGIDVRNLRLRVRRGHQFCPEHPWAIDVVRVFCGAGCLERRINTRNPLADKRTLFWSWPIYFCHITPFLSLHPKLRAASRHKYRNDINCLPTPLEPARQWHSDAAARKQSTPR